jgi:hypothetical protein
MSVNKENSFFDQKITVKALFLYILPLLLALLLGYVHVRSLNRNIEMRQAGTEQKIAAFEGEVYKLKQALEQRDAKLKYVLNPNYERMLMYSDRDSTYIWLFHDATDQSWYAEMSHARILKEGMNYKLLIDGEYIGKIERISDSVGLQKIGTAPMGCANIYSGLRGESATEELIYESAPPD